MSDLPINMAHFLIGLGLMVAWTVAARILAERWHAVGYVWFASTIPLAVAIAFCTVQL